LRLRKDKNILCIYHRVHVIFVKFSCHQSGVVIILYFDDIVDIVDVVGLLSGVELQAVVICRPVLGMCLLNVTFIHT